MGLLQNAKPGECYVNSVVPDQYETVGERVLKKAAATRIEVVPARLSAHGEVIGTAHSFHRDAPSLTFATPINVVKPLLATKGQEAMPFPPAVPPRP